MADFSDWTSSTPYLSVSPTTIPVLPTLSLSDYELDLIRTLQARAQHDRAGMELENAFYMGEQIISNLQIAIPDELAQKLRTLVGWPRIAADPFVERLGVDGFRLPGETEVNADLADLWDANGLDAEQSIAFTDALVMRRAYFTVGAADGGDVPRICAESPLNMAVLWDVSGLRAKAALQTYKQDGQQRAALYTPQQTIHIAQNDEGEWEIVSRDPHNFGYVPVVRMANNPRSYNRDGYSEITPELRSIVTSACRRLLGLEVSSELYSVPRAIFLGAQESDFQNPNGQTRKAWETYISLILAMERDDEGNLPDVKQLQTYDPSVFTRVIEMYASQAAGILSADPRDLGLYTEGNPTSAEAAQVSEGRRDRRARRKQAQYGVALRELMQLAVRFQNNGRLPREFERLAVDWADVSLQTPGVTSDAITKQIQVGAISATSDVTLKRLGYNAVERAQLEQDRGEQNLADIRQALADAAAKAKPAQPEEPVSDGDSADGSSSAG